MNLTMDDKVAENYKSNSQKIRVITEQWVSNNLFCPYCGKEKRGIIRMCEQVAASGNTLILYSA